jgi:hypothetical protein
MASYPFWLIFKRKILWSCENNQCPHSCNAAGTTAPAAAAAVAAATAATGSGGGAAQAHLRHEFAAACCELGLDRVDADMVPLGRGDEALCTGLHSEDSSCEAATFSVLNLTRNYHHNYHGINARDPHSSMSRKPQLRVTIDNSFISKQRSEYAGNSTIGHIRVSL